MVQFNTNIGKATRLVNNRHSMACVNGSGFVSSSGTTKSYNDEFWPHKDEAKIISYLLQWNLNFFKLNS